MTHLRSPIMWYGGKGSMTAKLLPLLPRHHSYVEPFAGGASLFWAKAPSPVEVLNDLDHRLVNYYAVLRDAVRGRHLQELLALTPYSREERRRCAEGMDDAEDEVEAARRFVVCARQGFSGMAYSTSWSYVRTATRRGQASPCSKWETTIAMLGAHSERIMRAQLECRPALDVIERFDSPETLYYCDPPYVHSTRDATHITEGECYQHEMADADHAALVDALLRIEGMAILSGYACEVYAPLEAAGWRRVDWQTACHAAGRTRGSNKLGKGAALANAARTESVYLCPRTVARLDAAAMPLLDTLKGDPDGNESES